MEKTTFIPLGWATAEPRYEHLWVIFLFYLILTFVYTPETIMKLKQLAFLSSQQFSCIPL